MKVPYRNKILKILFLSIYGYTFFVLTGCWDRREVNEMAIIMGNAIDKKDDDMIELSVQVFMPNPGGAGDQKGISSGGEKGKTFVRSATGVTLADAGAKLKEKFPREIFWGHSKVLIIGEKMAKEGVSDLVDHVMRYPEARVRVKVFICNGDAKHMLELTPPLENSTVNVLRQMTDLHSVIDIPLKTFAQMLAGNAGAAAVPWIKILPAEPHKSKNQTVPYIKGTAIFKNDKMVGHIDETITKGVLWLRNEMKPAELTITSKDAKGFVTLNVKKSKSELDPQIKDNEWSVTVKIKAEAIVIQNTTNLSFKNPKFSKSLERDLNENIENRVSAALAQVQKEMHADILGFAEAFYRKYPKEWEKSKEDWDEIFPTINVNIQVTSKIQSTGLSDTGISRPEKDVKQK